MNAKGGGTLEYQLNTGVFQTSNSFSGLAPGNYTITVRSQISQTCLSTYSGNPVVLNAATGCAPASAGDRVWYDADGDGEQDAGETGFNGVTVRLLNSSNTVIATTTTNANGNYGFSGLSSGTYKVMVSIVTLPSGVNQTYDLDGIIATPHIATFTLNCRTNPDRCRFWL